MIAPGDILDALRKLQPPPLPEWAQKIRDPSVVEVRADEHLPEGMIYVLDPTAMDDWYFFDAGQQPPPTMVLCHPDDEAEVRKAVEGLRASTPDGGKD